MGDLTEVVRADPRAPDLRAHAARRQGPRRTTIAAIDAGLILLGFAIAYWMRYIVDWPPPIEQVVREVATQNFVPFSAFLPIALLLIGLLLGQFTMKGLYRLPRTAGILDCAGIIISSTVAGIGLLVVALLILRPFFYSRLIFAFACVVIIALLCLWRGSMIGYQRWRWLRGVGRERVLVVGGTGLGRQVMEGIVAQPELGYALIGYLEDRDPPPSERPDGHFRHLGPIAALSGYIRSDTADQVIIALPFWQHSLLPELVLICRAAGIEFRVAPDLYELSFDRVDVGDLSGVPLIGLKELSLKGGNLVIKRAMDLLLVLLAAPVALAITGVVALLIKRDSPGPAIFKQWRVGKGGEPFITYKFRTMVADAEERKAELAALNEADGPLFKIRDDPRTTRVGRFLRRTSLDELPQLWNVVRGEMSLVGPRPATPEEVEQYEPWHKRRLEVRPGMSGLWQVLGRSDTSFDEMIRLDIYYAENWSPGMDLRIILRTIPVVLSGKGAY